MTETLVSDRKTPDGRSMVAIPFKVEFVAYVEEHVFYEHMTLVQGNLEALKALHNRTIVDTLEVDSNLDKIQQGWQTILVERVK